MRNVIFDIGGVLLDWSPDAILESYYVDPPARAAMKAALFQHPDWLDLDRGVLTEDEALQRLERRTEIARPELDGLFQAIRASLKPKADTVALLESLARRQVPLYCLSNMSAATFDYLRARHAFWSAFRGIVISGQIQLMKPERAIFDYLLQRYGLDPSETIFIDDHAPNVEAAQSLGIHTVLFRDARHCAVELERLLPFN